MRSEAYGQARKLSLVDRFGVWLSAVAVRRRVVFNDKRVADFGCGYDARLARTLTPVAKELLLVDVQLATDLAEYPNIQAVEGEIETVLPVLASKSLDIVLCLSVLEHLQQPQQALTAFHRILAPGGTALINVPSWRGKRWLELSAFKLGLSPSLEMDDHKRYYDPRDLWPLLVDAGFRPSEISCKRHKFGLNTFAACRVPVGTLESTR
jgi:SAM-dependent methyltransferase